MQDSASTTDREARHQCGAAGSAGEQNGLFASALLPMALIGATALLAFGLVVALPGPLLKSLLEEGGVVETATVVVYVFAMVAIWLVRNPYFDRASAVASTIVLTACVARELSFRRWIIEASDSSFCCANEVTAVVGIVILGALAGATVNLLRSHLVDVWRGLLRKRPIPTTLFAIACATTISQLFDRLPVLYPGHTLPTKSALFALSFEETFEFVIPVLVIVAALQARSAARKSG